MADNKFCRSCGTNIPKNSQFCLNCGTSLTRVTDKKICAACGTNIPKNSQFCLNCGASLTTAQAQVQLVRKAIYPRAAENVPHWTKPEFAVLLWVFGSFMLFIVAAGLNNASLYDLVLTSFWLSVFVGFFVFVGTEVYLNRKELKK